MPTIGFFFCWAFRFNFIACKSLHTISGDYIYDHRSDVKKANCDSLRLLTRPKVVLSKILSYFKGSHKDSIIIQT